VGGEVDAEADAHEQEHHGDAVQVDAPPRHVARDARAHGRDAERHPEGAHRMWDEQQRDDEDGGRGDAEVEDGARHDEQELVGEDEGRVEDGHGKVRRLVGDLTGLDG